MVVPRQLLVYKEKIHKRAVCLVKEGEGGGEGGCGSLLVTEGECGSLWVTGGGCGSLWVTEGGCGSLWVTEGGCGSCRACRMSRSGSFDRCDFLGYHLFAHPLVRRMAFDPGRHQQ
jgi:hypothetical protein